MADLPVVESCDFSDVGVLETDSQGQAVFTVTAIDDDTALESNEALRVRFEGFYKQFTEELESAGEFIRDMVYVHISDSDGKSRSVQCHLNYMVFHCLVEPCVAGFTQREYSVTEGAGSVSVCVNLTCPVNKTNSIELEIFSNDTTVPHPLSSM